jgi:adenylyltransferase/sulfurtransferase
MVGRYSRQILFGGIGEEGQKRLGSSYVAVIGCGGLGGIIATSLVRAGVGKIRIIDRDFIEYHNLHRQLLFDEDDIRDGLPKAIAAERHLRKVNSSVEVEGIAADVNNTNIEGFISDTDLVLDGLDNFEARFLINDACLKHRIPWIYGGAISSSGMTMTIIPGKTPCFRCFSADSPSSGVYATCDTAGVISPAPSVIGSLQVAEAMKLLVGSDEFNRQLLIVDVWSGNFLRVEISSLPGCPACQGNYEYLEGKFGMRTTTLCGQNAVQVLSAEAKHLSLKALAARLKPVAAQVSFNEFMLRFTVDNNEMVVFPDGRAILKNTTNESLARGLYSRYIGT